MVWPVASSFNQITVVPGLIVSVTGEKTKSAIFTMASFGPGVRGGAAGRVGRQPVNKIIPTAIDATRAKKRKDLGTISDSKKMVDPFQVKLTAPTSHYTSFTRISTPRKNASLPRTTGTSGDG